METLCDLGKRSVMTQILAWACILLPQEVQCSFAKPRPTYQIDIPVSTLKACYDTVRTNQTQKHCHYCAR